MSLHISVFSLATLLLCLCSSCTRTADKENIATMDSLLLIADSVRAGLAALDHEGLRALDSTFRVRKEAMDLRLRDTLSKDVTLAIGNYRRAMGKVLGKTLKEFERAEKELDLCGKQLVDLKKDVLNSVHEPELEDRYIIEERTALAAARQRAAGLVIKVQGAFRDDARFRPMVDSILQLHDSLP